MSSQMSFSRAHWLITRLTGITVSLAGLAVLGLGLQHTGAFGDTSLVGRLPSRSAPIVVTAPGMTELAGVTVRVRAASSAGQTSVFIGVGRAGDVETYLGTVARTEITALEETGVLRVESRPGDASLPDPAGVDVWAASVRAKGVATLTWPRTPGRWRLVIATDGRRPPSAAELTWAGSNGLLGAPALIAVGAMLFVAGVAALLAMRSGRIFASAAAGGLPRPSGPARRRTGRRADAAVPAGLARGTRPGKAQAGGSRPGQEGPDEGPLGETGPAEARSSRTGSGGPSGGSRSAAPSRAASPQGPPDAEQPDEVPAVLPFRRGQSAREGR